MSARAVPRYRGVVLGSLVFAGALAVWELWARRARSFYLPPVSEIASRAWVVWPSAEFRSAVSASLERFTARYAIGDVSAITLGLVVGASPKSQADARPDDRVPLRASCDRGGSDRDRLVGVGDAIEKLGWEQVLYLAGDGRRRARGNDLKPKRSRD